MKKCDRCKKEVEDLAPVYICDDGPWPEGFQEVGKVRRVEMWCLDCCDEENILDLWTEH